VLVVRVEQLLLRDESVFEQDVAELLHPRPP
jgi:hypothetical protein